MRPNSLLTLAALLVSTATGSPAHKSRSTFVDDDPNAWRMSGGFALYANLTDPVKAGLVFSKPLIYWTLSSVHIPDVLGQATAIIRPAQDDPTQDVIRPNVYYQNDTVDWNDQVGWIEPLGGISSDVYSPWPLSLVINGSDEAMPDPDGDSGPATPPLFVGVNNGMATPAVVITDADGTRIAQVATPFLNGTFVVCNETDPSPSKPQYPVRFVRTSQKWPDPASGKPPGLLSLEIPAMCVPISLVAQCADLACMDPDTGLENGTDNPSMVSCYRDVTKVTKWDAGNVDQPAGQGLDA